MATPADPVYPADWGVDDQIVDPDFRATHVVPRAGLSAWETPGTSAPTVPLDPFLPVRLTERTGDWGRVLCSNGWSAWVDARLLVSVPAHPPSAVRAMARTADPRRLLTRVEESVARYRQAAEDLAGGRTDREGFRSRTGGLRVGVVVEGESVWLFDAEHERWVYCDGIRPATYAASGEPSAEAEVEEVEEAEVEEAGTDAQADAEPAGGPAPDQEPTRVVGAPSAPEPDAGTTRIAGPADQPPPGPAGAGDR
ncbi:hypothetical protein I3F58_25845 [Streptomyces sp. MUM 203J]|uniref:hypothetical protein n=1 Tax=Streptomyces sp. MUM 203J TaxID=2791990 RepID=UPI001F035C31|nr:hypothetical protein [Streptomyces sp. MUM 203J]MCH0542916.1 hypothetical protein [Streptomyces sp. MUM 203J]